jgi:hypothetical protein
MKIRIQGNSLRCRLGRSELTAMLSCGKAVSETRFPGGIWSVQLCLPGHAMADEVTADGGAVTVHLHSAAFRAWAGSNQESYAFDVVVDGDTLAVLIEKDFPCDHSESTPSNPDLFTSETLPVGS